MSEQKEKFTKRVGKFFKEIRLEIKKVIFPTRQQLINNTIVVLLACFSVRVVVWIADAVLRLVFSAVFGQ